jgi:hypothetical protein
MTRGCASYNFLAQLLTFACFALATLALLTPRVWAVSCQASHHAAPTDADKALLSADYQKAVELYQTGLAAHPHDLELTTGLVHALLHQQKFDQAADVVKSSVAIAPNSAAVLTLRGEVEFRQGIPWKAAGSADAAFKIDPCNARTHLLISRIAHISSLYAMARGQILLAHKLDPEDPDIRSEWIDTLPRPQRIKEIESYLSTPNGSDPEDIRSLQRYLAALKLQLGEPHKPCHLVSTAASTEIPFIKLMEDANTMRAFGLDVKLNNKSARLEIDTGAGGLLISRSIAQRAGLKASFKEEIGGIGDQGNKSGYTAYVDSIRIGNLEFQNCQVSVIDSKNDLDTDGLIGMDVFDQFLVTLDYPMRKLVLGPLPPRPGEEKPAAQALQTDTSEAASDSEEAAPTAPTTAAANQNAPAVAQAAKPTPHGPYDRYVAPEMKDYTQVYRVGHDLIFPAALNLEKSAPDHETLRLFIMDTGAWATTISPQAAREVTKIHWDDTVVQGLSGKVNKVYTTGDISFSFAHLTQKTWGVYSFDTSGISRNVGMEISGFIGANTLSLLTIHIDYRDGLVKFDYDPYRGYRQ